MPTNFMEIEQPPKPILRLVKLDTGQTWDLKNAHFAGIDIESAKPAPKKVRFADGTVRTIREIRENGFEVYSVQMDVDFVE